MKEQNKQKHPLWAQIALSPLVQGPFLGAAVMVMATPFLKWTNHVYKGERMPLANPMSGAGAYAASALPGYAATFAFKALLKKPDEAKSKGYDLFTSLVAGGASGFVCAPFEAMAQNKQLTNNPSLKNTAIKMFTHNGLKSLFQGSVSIMLREGLWSVVTCRRYH